MLWPAAPFGKAMIEASTQITSLTLFLKQATGGLVAAKSALGFVRAESDRLGTSVTASTLGFTKLANATKGTTLAGEATRDILTASLVNRPRRSGSPPISTAASTPAVGSQIALKGRVEQEKILEA